MKKIKKLRFILVAILVLAGSFAGYQIVRAAAGDGTGTINVDGGAQGAGVTVVQSTSHIFKAVLTIGTSGMTLGATSPTFRIPAGFTAPNLHAVATAGDVNVDGEWSVTMGGPGGCTVDSAPGSALTVASGQTITVDITADCADTNTITLTYQGTSATTMVATQLVISTSDGAQPLVALTLAPGSPTITVTAPSATLNVIKAVTNDNGGTAVASAWTLTVTSSNGGSGTGSAAGAASPGTAYTLQTGKAYSVAESGGPASGYSPSSSSDCTIASAVAGTTYTCTITNNDIASGGGRLDGTINVVKTVINDNGGTKTVADFPLFINGNTVVSGVTNSFQSADGYVVTETADSNYARTFSGDCDENGSLNIGSGMNKFCIITNNDIGALAVVPIVPPLIDVVKTASPLALPAGAGPVTYTYTLRNIGTVPVTDITMVGDTCSPIVRVSGDTNGNNKLEVNETWVHTCVKTLPATHTNTVVATGWANGISAVDIASATVVVGVSIIPPLIHVVKKPNLFTVPIGGTVTYTYTVTNPGTAPLSNVSISDDKCTGLPGRVAGHPGDLNKNNLLESNEAWSFTCQSRLFQTTVNTGTAEGTANGLTARDFALATVVVTIPILPKTGFPPEEKSAPWNIIIPAGVFVTLFSFYITRKKKAI